MVVPLLLKLGLVTPVVNLNPRFDPPAWEIDGTVDDLVAVAQEADRLGYQWVSCPEHVAVPVAMADQRGGRYFDPVATLAYLAAATERIGLLSHVVVLGYHHPLALVKQYGTLDLLSGGRVILGVGVGSLEAEFDLLGADFTGRGARADDALGAIRAAFGRAEPSYDGSVYSFSGFRVEPSGVQDRLPIWVGGRTRRSLRRALAHGDGWIPFGLDADALATMLADPPMAELLSRRAGATGSAGGPVEPGSQVGPAGPADQPNPGRFGSSWSWPRNPRSTRWAIPPAPWPPSSATGPWAPPGWRCGS